MRFDLDTYRAFPVLVTPDAGNTTRAGELVAWLTAPETDLAARIVEHGAMLFRGFALEDSLTFEAICEAGTPGLVHYTGGGSPRIHVAGKIYTSTEYPPAESIPLHCEYTYFREIPRYIWFYCERPAEVGGETPIGDMRRVLEYLSPEVVERFQSRGVQYIYNLHGGDGFGRGWHTAFGTDDKHRVEAWLAERGAEHRWTDNDTLHIDLFAPALRIHDRTGTSVWGNQAACWHIAGLGKRVANNLLRVYKQADRLPKHARFADGGEIADADIHHILATLKAEETTFPWQRGDILVCDNQRIAHGRRPFKGARRILVALA